MRVFDSNKNRRWQGAGFAAKEDLLTILKTAKFYQTLSLSSGSYILRAIGRKKVGGGGVIIEISDKANVTLSSFKLDFSSSTWTEQVFSFKLLDKKEDLKIKVSRDPKSLGAVEVSRISLDLKNSIDTVFESNNPVGNTPLKNTDSKVGEDLYTGDPNVSPQIGFRATALKRPTYSKAPDPRIKKQAEPTSNVLVQGSSPKIAIIIPSSSFGDSEIYIKNLVECSATNLPVSFLYLERNKLKELLSAPRYKHYEIENAYLLIQHIQEVKYDYIIYYERIDVYNLLSSQVSYNDINSKLVEIYFGQGREDGSLAKLGHRQNIYKIITTSPSLARNIDGIDLQVREVIPPGVDTSLFSKSDNKSLRRTLGLADKKIIGTVTDFSKGKNIDKIITLARELSEFSFLILGDGPEKERFDKIISEEKINNVKLLDKVDSLPDYYRIFNAYLSLSDFEDIPISMIQAMSCEVPVFSTEVGLVNDLIKDTITGFTVSSNDLDLTAQKIRKNIDNKEVIKNARKYVEKSFNSKINSEEFFNFFFK